MPDPLARRALVGHLLARHGDHKVPGRNKYKIRKEINKK